MADPAAEKAKKPKRRLLTSIREAYKRTREVDPKIGWIMLAWLVGIFLLFAVLGWFFWDPIVAAFMGLATGILVALFVLVRRAEAAEYSQIEGKPGAAGAVLNTLRKGWVVEPAISVTRNQDIVHRAIGRCGIVLVGEGTPSRVANLLANEKRKHARVAPDAPVFDIIVGDGDGQIPIRKLSKHVQKLPRSIRPAEVTDIVFRLKALQTQPLPIPRGPIPQNLKVPRSAKVR